MVWHRLISHDGRQEVGNDRQLAEGTDNGVCPVPVVTAVNPIEL